MLNIFLQSKELYFYKNSKHKNKLGPQYVKKIICKLEKFSDLKNFLKDALKLSAFANRRFNQQALLGFHHSL